MSTVTLRERTPPMVGGESKFMPVRSFPQVALKNLLVPYRAPVPMTFEWLYLFPSISNFYLRIDRLEPLVIHSCSCFKGH